MPAAADVSPLPYLLLLPGPPARAQGGVVAAINPRLQVFRWALPMAVLLALLTVLTVALVTSILQEQCVTVRCRQGWGGGAGVGRL